MDLLSLATGYITRAFVKNKKAQEFKDDFVTAFINWIRPIFLTDDPKLIEVLDDNPEDGKTQGRLEARLEHLLKDPNFQNELEIWLNKPEGAHLKEKNIFEADEIKGANLNVGDDMSDNDNYQRKNIVAIKKGEFSGDINIGDKKR